VNTALPAPLDDATITRILQASRAEAAAGRAAESEQLLVRLAHQAPNHPGVLNELGVLMLGRGAAEQAYALFVRATDADPRHPSLWANLASSLKALGRRAEEMDALEKALQLEPRHLSALLQKGAYLEQSGDVRGAARTYQNALACIPSGADAAPAVREALSHAKALVEADYAALAAELEGPLAAVRERHGGGRQRRVDLCLEALLGRRSIFYSQPTWMYFPELPAIEFFERADFPWLDAIEAASDEIRAELLRVLEPLWRERLRAASGCEGALILSTSAGRAEVRIQNEEIQVSELPAAQTPEATPSLDEGAFAHLLFHGCDERAGRIDVVGIPCLRVLFPEQDFVIWPADAF